MRTLLATGLLLAVFAAFALSCSTGTTPGDQTTANVTANEMVYGTENDEVTSGDASSAPMDNALLPPTTVTDSVIFAGLVSGTVTVAHDVTWTDTGAAPDVAFNRTFTFAGTRSFTFSDYSNVPGRTVDGTVSATIASGNFQSSNGGNASPAVGSTVTHTATNVNKTITGTVTTTRNGHSYTCAVNLTVDVISRTTNWTLAVVSPPDLTSPVVTNRDVTVTGTVTVNGTVFNVNETLMTSLQ